jgi:hypothetical protein
MPKSKVYEGFRHKKSFTKASPRGVAYTYADSECDGKYNFKCLECKRRCVHDKHDIKIRHSMLNLVY